MDVEIARLEELGRQIYAAVINHQDKNKSPEEKEKEYNRDYRKKMY
jgi:hypothetical protein